MLIDTPPVNAYADHLALAALSCGALLVVEFAKTGRESIQRALSSLRREAPPLGLIINKQRRVIPDWLYRHL